SIFVLDRLCCKRSASCPLFRSSGVAAVLEVEDRILQFSPHASSDVSATLVVYILICAVSRCKSLFRCFSSSMADNSRACLVELPMLDFWSGLK
ncbi:hypothetical protein NPIL_370921, partial [Nephila pilipes]